MAEPLKKPAPSLYDRDFYAWTQDQAAKLRARGMADNEGVIDWENAAEEIESLGRSEKRALESRLAALLLHLLKWRCQPAHRSGSWKGSIAEQRRRLARLLAENPSLHTHPGEVLASAYATALADAVAQTGLDRRSFPATCPFTIEEALDLDFYPEAD